MTGFPVWASIVSIGIVCTFYTTIVSNSAFEYKAVSIESSITAQIIVVSENDSHFGNCLKNVNKVATFLHPTL